MTTRAEEIAAVLINPEDVKRAEGGFYYKVLCHECGWFGSSQDCGGGLPTGGDDYTDIECPDCQSTRCAEPSELDIMAMRKAAVKGYKQGQQDRWIPEGWTLVPLVATPEMLLNSGFPASSTGDSTTGQNTWEWFVKSAPSPPNPEQR